MYFLTFCAQDKVAQPNGKVRKRLATSGCLTGNARPLSIAASFNSTPGTCLKSKLIEKKKH